MNSDREATLAGLQRELVDAADRMIQIATTIKLLGGVLPPADVVVPRTAAEALGRQGAVKSPQATNGHTKPPKANGKAKSAQKAARAPRGGVQKAVLAASGEFGPEEIATANPGFSMATIRATIQRLHEKGQLKRVARGLYERVLVDG